jgi:DNA polymerase/3'-5' exonuclease PolX
MPKRPIQLIQGITKQIAAELLEGVYTGIKHKVKYAEDIKASELKYLPKEARLTIKLLDGTPYSKKEIDHLITKWIKPFCKKYAKKWEITGSYRRKKYPCNDVDLLVILNTNPIFRESKNLHVIRNGDQRTKLILRADSKSRFIPLDIFYTEPEWWPFSLLHFTGSKVFNIHVRKAAKSKGYKLNEYGLYKGGKKVSGLKTEKQILMKVIGKYYKPEERTK